MTGFMANDRAPHLIKRGTTMMECCHHKPSSRFGSDNDDVLLTEEPIKWKESLSPKEFGFGDSAFNKHQHLQVYTIRNQGSLHRHFSHYRIRIEISIGKIKKFGAASSIIRMIVQGNEEAVLRHHHQVWVIGAVFVNRYKLG
eukprot:TRINITY_DN445_c0_g1_i5.p1 TRINITY_DN445_c0_g1~~TRINITY_DN445_c0_g1_i5.p1  ORF type:complete len:142 (-),score=26.24 TRINITY_DN445_c0_g1_i5:168-593(-)